MEKLTDDQIKTMSYDTAELIYSEADKQLNSLIHVESTITDRGYLLLGFYFAVLSTMLGYILSTINNTCNAPTIAGALSLLIFSIISIYYTYQVIKPHEYYSVGKGPEYFNIAGFTTYFQKARIYDKSQRKIIICRTLPDVQNKINKQANLNIKRTNYILLSIKTILIGSFVAVISYFITYFLVSLHHL